MIVEEVELLALIVAVAAFSIAFVNSSRIA
jgi:hypothetical protein